MPITFCPDTTSRLIPGHRRVNLLGPGVNAPAQACEFLETGFSQQFQSLHTPDPAMTMKDNLFRAVEGVHGFQEGPALPWH